MLRKDQCWRCDSVCVVPLSKIHCDKCEVAYYCSDKCKGSDEFRHRVDCKTAAQKKKCAGCGKENTGLKPCGCCSQVFYCDKECQKKSWPKHKVDCLQVTRETNELSRKLKFSFDIKASMNILGKGTAYLYYWGNVPAVDLINLPLNESCNYSKPLSILACGVGDPRNVVLSLSELPEAYQKELTFVLNDICACTLARTVFILYLLLKDGEQVANSVTQIWYSLRLSNKDYKLVVRTLQELINAASLEELTRGVMKMDQGQFHRLCEVWRTWLQLSARREDWITEVRRKGFEDLGADIGVKLYLKEIPQEHQESATDWFENGILSPKEKRERLPRENFTLTGSDYQSGRNKGVFTYMIESSVIPFCGWDYKEVKRWGHSPSILKMYSEYVSHVLQKCALKLATGRVKFHFLLCNCMEIAPFLPPDLKYDRVATSNIADYVPLTSILDICEPLLNPGNTSSVMITEFQNWSLYTSLKSDAVLTATFTPKDDSFRGKILEDTENPAIAHSTAYQAFVEYQDHSDKFIQFLRASFLVCENSDERNRRRTWKSVADHNGLIARNFLRCQNRVFPAKWMLNCRSLVLRELLNGFSDQSKTDGEMPLTFSISRFYTRVQYSTVMTDGTNRFPRFEIDE